MQDIRHNRSWKAYQNPILLWLAIIFSALLWLTISYQFSNRDHFNYLSNQIKAEAAHHAEDNEAVLETLSELIGPSELFLQDQFHTIADALARSHPQIEAILLLPTVPGKELENLVRHFKNHNPETAVQRHNTPTGNLSSPIMAYYGKEVFLPLGIDGRQIDALAPTLELVSIVNHPMSTTPHQIDDQLYYYLIGNSRKPASTIDTQFPIYTDIHIALMINPEKMVSTVPDASIALSLFDPTAGSRVALFSSGPTTDSKRSTLTRMPLQFQTRLDSMSQPFLVDISTEKPLIHFSWNQLLLLTAFSMLYFYLVHRQIMRETDARVRQENSEKRLLLNTKNRIQMLNAISHDIRTPLTRLQLRVATYLADSARERSMSDLKEIELLVETSLNYLREEEKQEAPIITNINDLMATIQQEMAEQKLLFNLQGRARWSYLCQRLQLKRAIQNLLNNAFHYAEQVEVQIHDQYRNLTIEILDNGPGIANELLEKVTRPYFRVEDSRNSETGGVGLGLSIVREVSEAHDGTLILRNRPKGGLSASIILPR